MRKFKNRDRPGRMPWLEVLITCIAILAIFGVVGALGGFGSLFKDKDKTPGISIDDENKPPYPEYVNYRGSGKYANASGVLTYDYEGDITVEGYDFGFKPGLISDEYNWSKPVNVKGNSCWEFGRSNVTEPKNSISMF